MSDDAVNSYSTTIWYRLEIEDGGDFGLPLLSNAFRNAGMRAVAIADALRSAS